MAASIHATAIVEDGARIGEGVTIGPYCAVGPEVEIGDGAVLEAHAVVGGRTRLGPDTHVYPFASVGQRPQDLKYAGEPSELVVGEGTVIREHATLHPGTAGGRMQTRVGAHCMIMVGSHVAHDCRIGDHVILTNNATLGGHVVIDDHAIVGGMSAIHQFVRIGAHAMVGGMTGVENDVIPYGSVVGNRAYLSGLNIIGLKRRGFGTRRDPSAPQRLPPAVRGRRDDAGAPCRRLRTLRGQRLGDGDRQLHPRGVDACDLPAPEQPQRIERFPVMGTAQGRDCGPPVVRRARAGADRQVRCRERQGTWSGSAPCGTALSSPLSPAAAISPACWSRLAATAAARASCWPTAVSARWTASSPTPGSISGASATPLPRSARPRARKWCWPGRYDARSCRP